MKKIVIIINGNGGAGKDTLCDFAGEVYDTMNISAITPIKEIAKANGWNGEKDAKSRKFLADLKQIFVSIWKMNIRNLKKVLRRFCLYISEKEKRLISSENVWNCLVQRY